MAITQSEINNIFDKFMSAYTTFSNLLLSTFNKIESNTKDSQITIQKIRTQNEVRTFILRLNSIKNADISSEHKIKHLAEFYNILNTGIQNELQAPNGQNQTLEELGQSVANDRMFLTTLINAKTVKQTEYEQAKALYENYKNSILNSKIEQKINRKNH